MSEQSLPDASGQAPTSESAGIPLDERAAAFQTELDALKRALDDGDIPLPGIDPEHPEAPASDVTE